MNVGTEFATAGEPFVNPAYDYLVSDISSDSVRLVLDAAAHPDNACLTYDEASGIDLRPYITTDRAAITTAGSSWTDAATDGMRSAARDSSYNLEAILEAISQLDFRHMDARIIDKFVEIPFRISTEELFDFSPEPDEDCDPSALKAFLNGIEVKQNKE